eukprot:TRINITY_DN91478_c0_g1_i1.p1 TRINITY_DN91478_c0_g1~~TRINITY_DN91478_c0_g1_i1.p1  ORF type:complete len:186 (+),score=35.04 TRINITY_DN91478_c0_g1_i1:67-624(+)
MSGWLRRVTGLQRPAVEIPTESRMYYDTQKGRWVETTINIAEQADREDDVQAVFTLLEWSNTSDFGLELVLSSLSGESFEVCVPRDRCKSVFGSVATPGDVAKVVAAPEQVAKAVSMARGIPAKSVKLVNVEGSVLSVVPPPVPHTIHSARADKEDMSDVLHQLCEPPPIYHKLLLRQREAVDLL